MTEAKKRESPWGLILTGLLCAGFLWWWFRPLQPGETWTPQSARELVAKAAAETRPPAGATVLDLDFMEVAVLQCSVQRLEEALATAGNIADPAVRQVAARHMAQAWINSDPGDFGQALRAESLLPEGEREEFRTLVLEQFSRAGFAEEGLKAARTPGQRARLARIMAETGDGEGARKLYAEITRDGIPPELQVDAAMVLVHLALEAGPAQAIPAVAALPPEKQEPVWMDLYRLMFGRGETAQADAAAVLVAVPDEALRWRLATESLESNVQIKSSAEVLGYYQGKVSGAASPEAAFPALLDLHRAQRAAEMNAPSASENATTGPSAITLSKAREIAAKTPDAGERCRRYLTLATQYADDILLNEAQGCLTGALQAAESVKDPAGRAAALTACAGVQRLQGQPDEARASAQKAWELTNSSTAMPAEVLTGLAEIAMRAGDWPRALELHDKLPPEPRRDSLIQLATIAAVDALSDNPAEPPARGHPVDAIRNAAPAHEEEASALAASQPAGLDRARAWLALARGVLTGKGMPDGLIPGSELPLALPDATLQPSAPGAQ